ncbi:MAG: ribosomal large subunit pseudouridine synthase B [Bacteroidaceae bacterium]|nr:ribosomal large subunit pseudouridine synthase B [Bacteroidaceae bacterium]
MKYSSTQINRDWRIKVDGYTEDGRKLHTLLGVRGTVALIGEEFLNKFLDRAYASMLDACTCKLRRGIVITFYAK